MGPRFTPIPSAIVSQIPTPTDWGLLRASSSRDPEPEVTTLDVSMARQEGKYVKGPVGKTLPKNKLEL